MVNRRILVRSVALLLYLGLLVMLLLTGKGHVILLDNKSDSAGAWKAFRYLEASVNGQKPVELARNERAEIRVRGQSHLIEITLEDGRIIKQAIELGLNDAIMVLSVPRLAANLEPWLEPFVQPARVRVEAEPEVVPVDPLAVPAP